MSALNIGELFSGVGSLEKTKEDVLSNALDFSSEPPIEPNLISGNNAYVFPVSLTNDEGPFDFEIPAGGQDQFFQTHDIRLIGKIKLVLAADGADLTLGAHGTKIGLINNWPHSLWKSVEVHVNGELISSLSGTFYHYKSYLENILSYNEATMKSVEADYIWPPPTLTDVAHFHDVAHHPKSTSVLHKAYAADDKALGFSIPLNFDFIKVEKLMLPGVNLRFKFVRNNDAFTLFCAKPADGAAAGAQTPEVKIKIVELQLQIRKVNVEPTYSAALQKSVAAGKPARFPFTKTQVKTYQVPSGLETKHIQGLFTGGLPKFLIIGMVESKAFFGDRYTNPYTFKKNGLKEVRITRNNEIIPAYPYYPTREGRHRLYRDFHDSLGNQGNAEMATVITPDLFDTTHFLLATDFSPLGNGGYELYRDTYGDISATLVFDPQESPFTLVCFASWNSHYFISGEPKTLFITD